MRLSIPSFFSQASTLVEKAAAEEAVVSAMRKVGKVLLMSTDGETFLRKKINKT